MLTREELEASYLNHVTQAHNHLDAARTSKSSVTKGFHIAQALTMAQLATASAMALAAPSQTIMRDVTADDMRRAWATLTNPELPG